MRKIFDVHAKGDTSAFPETSLFEEFRALGALGALGAIRALGPRTPEVAGSNFTLLFMQFSSMRITAKSPVPPAFSNRKPQRMYFVFSVPSFQADPPLQFIAFSVDVPWTRASDASPRLPYGRHRAGFRSPGGVALRIPLPLSRFWMFFGLSGVLPSFGRLSEYPWKNLTSLKRGALSEIHTFSEGFHELHRSACISQCIFMRFLFPFSFHKRLIHKTCH
jgi:hypothetical protein